MFQILTTRQLSFIHHLKALVIDIPGVHACCSTLGIFPTILKNVILLNSSSIPFVYLTVVNTESNPVVKHTYQLNTS